MTTQFQNYSSVLSRGMRQGSTKTGRNKKDYLGRFSLPSYFAGLMQSKAFLFDLNGTMIDDMEYHTRAWYDILNRELNASLSWEALEKEMYGKNRELLIRVFGPDRFTEAEIEALSLNKEKRYQAAFREQLRLIPGLETFLKEAHKKGIPLGIGSAAILFNVDFVVDGLQLRDLFQSIVCAEHVQTSKPHPETFLKGAEELGTPPENCIVFEDAPKGVEAALNAGMKAVVLTTMHEREEFEGYPNILFFIKDYTDPALAQLL